MMTDLKILILEDSTIDAELVQRQVKKETARCEFKVAMSKKDFLNALEEFHPDVILSDNSLPQFDSLEALRLTRHRDLYVPFILVTGTVDEEFAATIIKTGADDYILKDRMARLPAAIEAAIKKRRAEKEIADYRYALDQTAIVAITDQNGIITYANENFSRISRYTTEELIGQDHQLVNSHYHPQSYVRYLWVTIAHGKIWRGEFRNKARDGNLYWVDTTIIPFINDKGRPYQYLSIGIDITERKKLETELREQQIKEQLKLTATALEAQEKERNFLGQELHDNVNQLLVGTKLLLSMIRNNPGKVKELIGSSIEYLQHAIDENRKLSHRLVTPDLTLDSLARQILSLASDMLETAGVKVVIDTGLFDEQLLTDQQKITIYRIAQEQCTNIIKYAKATNANIVLKTVDDHFKMTISDDGLGMDTNQMPAGIGLRNITGRLSVFGGAASITTAPGKGFILDVEMPVKK